LPDRREKFSRPADEDAKRELEAMAREYKQMADWHDRHDKAQE
jgi:hypothetical protein